MEVPYQPKRTCSANFRNEVAKLYPGLGDSYEYWRLLEWLIYSPWRDKTTGRLVMSSDVLRHQVGLGDRQAKNWSLNELLARFGADVFEIQVGGFRYGQARTLLSELPERLESIATVELRRVRARDEERVWFCNGFKVRRQEMANELKRLRQEAHQAVERVYGRPLESGGAGLHAEAQAETVETLQNHGCLLAYDLLNYLNELPVNGFDQVKDHLEEAYLMVDQVSADPRRQRQILNSIGDLSQPFYRPTEPDPLYDANGIEIGKSARSVRIFSMNDSILRLQREIRDVFTKDWIKLDLRAAQLAVVSHIWNADSVKSFLRDSRNDGRSVWKVLIEWMGLENSPTNKSKLKSTTYSLVFGMGKTKMQAQLEASFPNLDQPWKRFSTHPIIADLLKARKVAFHDLRLKGFGVDAFGQKIPVRNKLRTDEGYQPTNIPSVAAIIAQSFELALMEPIIRMAIEKRGKTDGYVLTAWLHDGCWIHVTDSRNTKRWKNRINSEVEQLANRLDIPTWIEWDEN